MLRLFRRSGHVARLDAAGGPHGAKDYNDIVAKYGLAATRDFLKEADPFHDAESDAEYWAACTGRFP